MTKKIRFAIFLGLLPLATAGQDGPQKTENVTENLVGLVNPLMGTQSEFEFSNGNTYPAIAMPWGMNFWTPQTGKMGDGWTYNYNAYMIRGFKQTHQPSPWINDYGAFSLMPVTGQLRVDEESRASWFSHKTEIAAPNYYRVYLADHDVTAEIAPTERAAQFRFTFPESDSSFVVLDGFDMGSSVQIFPEERRITGYCRNNHGGVPDNFRNYFVLEFDHDFSNFAVWDSAGVYRTLISIEGDHVGAAVGFKTSKGDRIGVKVASSFISIDQARLNLGREIGDDDFETTKKKSEAKWEKELGRIRVEGGTEEQQRTFYSCLYRVLLFPRSFYEWDKDNNMAHYSPYNGEIRPGYMFTDNGFWDTFRAVFPFFTIMYPELNAKIMDGLVNTYKESGWLPEWASPGHRDCMIGSNSASIIADAYLKGIRGYDIETLYEAIVKNTKGPGPVRSVGRYGAEYYNKSGYVPYDVGIRENAARTLEYAYADFAIMQLAKALEKPEEEIALYRKRALSYRNLFDPETNLMRGKNKDGTFQKPFNPFKWGDAFTEGNSWHYTWSVFQDVEGLIRLMGGEQPFTAMLDSVFSLPPIFDESYYGFVIHEIREMQVMNMGQYAHGNQPIQHMPYLYNYTGEPWKTQLHVRNVMNKLYTPHPDGYCGDEDNGQTSAWYVFSAMGFYPVCPGANQYVIGSPLFEKITLRLENGKEFVVEAKNNGPQNVYIESAELNGKIHKKNWIGHEEIMAGGTLRFDMGTEPETERGIGPDDKPFSMSLEK